MLKSLVFLGSSQDDLRDFPADARHALGLELMRVQFGATIYVLHAFQKKTQKTSRADIDLARKRYKQIGDQP